MLSDRRLEKLSLGVSERPSIVWRVAYPGNAGFELEPRLDYEPAFEDKHDFRAQRRRHLDWDHSLASPFVSVFSSESHAVRWGRRMHATTLYEISARRLTLLFRGAQADEYLVLGPIPDACVRRTLSFEDDVVSPRFVESIPTRGYRPWRTYHNEAEGYYTDEDDAQDDIDEANLIEYYMNH